MGLLSLDVLASQIKDLQKQIDELKPKQSRKTTIADINFEIDGDGLYIDNIFFAKPEKESLVNFLTNK